MIFLKDKRLFVLGGSAVVALILLAVLSYASPATPGAIEVSAPETKSSLASDIENGFSQSGVVLTEGASYLVERVANSNLIVLKTGGSGTPVKLLGVQDPESAGIGACYTLPSINAITDLLRDTSVIVGFEQGTPSTDTFGNPVAYLILPDGTILNEAVLRMGYGKEDSNSVAYSKADAFARAEVTARISGRGIWGSACPTTSLPPLPGWTPSTEPKSTGTTGTTGGTTGSSGATGSTGGGLDALPPPPPPPPPPSL